MLWTCAGTSTTPVHPGSEHTKPIHGVNTRAGLLVPVTAGHPDGCRLTRRKLATTHRHAALACESWVRTSLSLSAFVGLLKWPWG